MTDDKIPNGCVFNLLSNATCSRGSFRCDRKHRSLGPNRESDVERLTAQAQEISVLLTDAGCSAMPIPEGVRWLIAQLEAAQEAAATWRTRLAEKIAQESGPHRETPQPDPVCEHGTAMDVHCCGCHSGFLFDIQSCTCLTGVRPMNVPRRNQINKFSDAEEAIWEAVGAVEAAGADVRLTDAVVLLQAARDSVADFVDGIMRRRTVSEGPDLGDCIDVLRAAIAETEDAGASRETSHGWQPIKTCPLAVTVLLWSRAWRSPFVGLRNGDFGACWLDGDGGGFQMHGATHWMPLPDPPVVGAALPHEKEGETKDDSTRVDRP